MQLSDTASVEVLPPAPELVAPLLDRTVDTTVFESTSFLYTGSLAAQLGVAPGTIVAERSAVVRGQVSNRDDTPLSGVMITAVGHPEYGYTLTRSDGSFDFVVNGGGPVTLSYARPGVLPAHRTVETAWQEFAFVDEVALIPLDTQSTAVAFGVGAPAMIATGSEVTDATGARQPTLLFPAETTATLVFANGSTADATSLTVRLTEYTVGASAREAMPAPLPPTSQYTYAVELSADEALLAGASRVQFSPAIPFYVDNFINFPVGTTVPVGAYDFGQQAWLPANNGLVLKIVGETGGVAALDANGDDVYTAADDPILATLGVTTAEREQLFTRYGAAPRSLWRLALTFFSRWDANWPGGAPTDAIPPNGGSPSSDDEARPFLADADRSADGSILFQTQTLVQNAEVVGTPYTLTYQSDRQLDRTALNTLTIPISGSSVPDSLLRIDAEVRVAGQRHRLSFDRVPDQFWHFPWDGKDAYGRLIQGRTLVEATIEFVYQQVYMQPAQSPQAFAQVSGLPISGTPQSRGEIVSGRTWTGTVGGWDAQAAGLGGWNLNVQRAYDPLTRMVNGGDGRDQASEEIGPVIRTTAGTGTFGFAGDGQAATTAQFAEPFGLAVAADGTLYVADKNNHRIRRIGTDGTITTVVGSGTPGLLDDPDPLLGRLLEPKGVAVAADGTLYIADTGNHRIRKVAPNGGALTTIAGIDVPGENGGFSGDGEAATSAALKGPSAVRVAPDGTLYIADGGNRVRTIDANGIIRTVAGGGQGFGFNVFTNGLPATQAHLSNAFGMDVALAPDGSFYVSGGFQLVRQVRTDGTIHTVAGDGSTGGDSGDGGLATDAKLREPNALTVGPDGTLYILDNEAARVRVVSPDGFITGLAGTGTFGFSGDLGPAAAARMNEPSGIVLAPDGSLYVTDTNNQRIRKIGSALPGFAGLTDITIASRDGRELYIFNSRGKHQSTVDAITSVVKYQFAYNDPSGRLTSITDADGNTTEITRTATQVVLTGPFAQVTTITLDNGYVDKIYNPNNEMTDFDFSAKGLLTKVTDAEGHETDFSYDPNGRLITALYPRVVPLLPVGDTLNRTTVAVPDGSGYQVTHTTAEDVGTTYKVEFLPDGRQVRTTLLPDDTVQTREIKIDGTEVITQPSNVVQTLAEGPDPRFGMQAPVDQTTTVTVPIENGTLTATVTSARSIQPAVDPTDPFNFTTHTETATVNGRTVTRTYNPGPPRTYTDISPMGRQTTTELDTANRPTQQQVGNLTPTAFGYDGEGRVTSVLQGTRSNAITYDTAGNVDSVTDSAGRTVSFDYDDAGRVITQTFPDLRTIGLTYDSKGNVTSITPPSRPAHEFVYSPTNLPLIYAPPTLGQFDPRTMYDYNLSGQLTRINRPDGRDLFLNYDPVTGDLFNQVWDTGARGFVYDQDSGNLELVTFGDETLTYTYDGSLLKSETWEGTVDGSVSRSYDNSFRVAMQQVNNANPVTFSYDNDDLLTGAALGSSNLTLTRSGQTGLLTDTTLGIVTDEYGYNTFGEVTSYTARVDGTPIFEVSYARDALGRIESKIETIDGVGPTTIHYKYDPAGRLWRVCDDDNCTSIQSEYLYDDNGNRIGGTKGGVMISGTVDQQDRLIAYTAGLTSATFDYTNNGELESKTEGTQTTGYTYDVLGNLTHVELPNGDDIDYVIDGRDRRIGRKENGTLVQGLLFDSQLTPVAEVDGSSQVVGRFVYASKANVPDYVIRGATTYRIISDHLGSPRLVIDPTGTVVQRTDYDEFGNILSEDIDPAFDRLPFGFAGGLLDLQTRLVRFGARDYDPETGRWTTKDPIGFGGAAASLYQYVGNDPANRIDPLGLASNFGELQAGESISSQLAARTVLTIGRVLSVANRARVFLAIAGATVDQVSSRLVQLVRPGGLNAAVQAFQQIAGSAGQYAPGNPSFGPVMRFSDQFIQVTLRYSTYGPGYVPGIPMTGAPTLQIAIAGVAEKINVRFVQ